MVEKHGNFVVIKISDEICCLISQEICHLINDKIYYFNK